MTKFAQRSNATSAHEISSREVKDTCRPREIDADSWPDIVDEIDERIALAIKVDFDPDAIAAGFTELVKLWDGDDPDYRIRGVANAYAFRYLARRTTSIVGALRLADLHPSSVLDVGCGSGAAGLAITFVSPSASIVGVDPSQEMLSFAALLEYGPCIETTWIEGGIENLHEATSGRHFDLILLSLCLNYRDTYDWSEIAPGLLDSLSHGGSIIAIEPLGTSKADELEHLGDILGMHTDVVTHTCGEFPGFLRLKNKLFETTNILRPVQREVADSSSLQGRGEELLWKIGVEDEDSTRYCYNTYSWNPDATDSILIATKA